MRFSAVLAALILFFSCAPASAAQTPAKVYKAPKQIVVTFVGDCTLGNTPIERRRVTSSFEYFIQENGYAYPFAKVQSVIGKDDLTVANLESVFYNYDTQKKKKTYNFRSSRAHAKILPKGSVEAVSLANNHTLDYGVPGLSSTTDCLNIQKVGWFANTDNLNKYYIYEKDGAKIGFISVYGSYIFQGNHSEKVKKNIQAMKKAGCQVIVACMHTGVEYDVIHDKGQEKLADRLIKYGAHVVVGTHPHTIQGIRVENGRTTLWSLGNFVFGGNSEIRTMDTYLAQITFSFSAQNKYLGHQLNIIPAHVSGTAEYNNYQPVLVRGSAAAAVIKAIQKDSRPLRLKPYVDGVGAIQDFVPAPK